MGKTRSPIYPRMLKDGIAPTTYVTAPEVGHVRTGRCNAPSSSAHADGVTVSLAQENAKDSSDGSELYSCGHESVLSP